MMTNNKKRRKKNTIVMMIQLMMITQTIMLIIDKMNYLNNKLVGMSIRMRKFHNSFLKLPMRNLYKKRAYIIQCLNSRSIWIKTELRQANLFRMMKDRLSSTWH